MTEELKLKYRNNCNNIMKFYKFIDKLSNMLITNPMITKEEKIDLLEEIKEKEQKLYQTMMEDLYAGLW